MLCTKFRSFIFFLFVALLLAVFSVLFLPSAAEASPSNASFYDNTTGRTLAGEPDIHAIIKKYRNWAEWMYNYQQNPASDPHAHSGFSADVCPVCGAGIDSWHVNYTSGNDYLYSKYRPYVAYHFNCSSCRTSLTYKYYRYYDSIVDVVVWTGSFGSPLIGRTTQVVDFSGNLVKQFLNFILNNSFVLVIVAIPIFGICLSLVLRFKKGV